MDLWNIVLSFVAAVLGGTIVAVVNHRFQSGRDTVAERRRNLDAYILALSHKDREGKPLDRVSLRAYAHAIGDESLIQQTEAYVSTVQGTPERTDLREKCSRRAGELKRMA